MTEQDINYYEERVNAVKDLAKILADCQTYILSCVDLAGLDQRPSLGQVMYWADNQTDLPAHEFIVLYYTLIEGGTFIDTVMAIACNDMLVDELTLEAIFVIVENSIELQNAIAVFE